MTDDLADRVEESIEEIDEGLPSRRACTVLGVTIGTAGSAFAVVTGMYDYLAVSVPAMVMLLLMYRFDPRGGRRD